jgi:thiosulfate/3-mercaptopyruvate sulfurtransferase
MHASHASSPKSGSRRGCWVALQPRSGASKAGQGTHNVGGVPQRHAGGGGASKAGGGPASAGATESRRRTRTAGGRTRGHRIERVDTLISAQELADLLAAGPLRPSLLDVRWELATGPQRDEYLNAHIPGAAFVDLDADLADLPGTGAGGRHPIPDPDRFAAAMRAAGVNTHRPVVVYDAKTSMAAARAWWLLRYCGHPDVRVLDGGLETWTEAGYESESGTPESEPGDFAPQPGAMQVLDAQQAAEIATHGILLDARAPERFKGESEPIDPVAGHIPGARNHPTTENVDSSGRFRDPTALRAAFGQLGAPIGAYCGSGITAAHAVLALHLAGYEAALYPGSWSEWITDPSRPIATG